MLSYKNVKSARQWKSSTGLSEPQFHQLCKHFEETHDLYEGVSLSDLSARLGIELLLASYADCLFYVLFQLKNGLCYDNLGLLIGSDGANAQRNFEKYLTILEKTLERTRDMPQRNFKDVESFKQYLQSEQEIILDASEQATQRPKDPEQQKGHYSGKKNAIRTKN